MVDVDSMLSVVTSGETDVDSAASVVLSCTTFDKFGLSTSFSKLDVSFKFCPVVICSFISSEKSVLAMDINSVNKVSLVEVIVDEVVTSTSNWGVVELFESPTVVESVFEIV